MHITHISKHCTYIIWCFAIDCLINQCRLSILPLNGMIIPLNIGLPIETRALLRLERTMNLLEGGKGGEGRVGERGWGGEGGRVGRGRGREREGGREGGRGGREGGEGEGEGGMTVIHIIIGIFNSNPMIPQYLNNNLT